LTSQYNSDFFRNRVLFPIHNLSGKVIGFGGRTLQKDKKYQNILILLKPKFTIKAKYSTGHFMQKRESGNKMSAFW